MKRNIRTKAFRTIKFANKYNNTYSMILNYVYLGFFGVCNERSIRDVCRHRVPPFMHEWRQTREYRMMCMCRNTRSMRKFNRDVYRYSMHYM